MFAKSVYRRESIEYVTHELKKNTKRKVKYFIIQICLKKSSWTFCVSANNYYIVWNFRGKFLVWNEKKRENSGSIMGFEAFESLFLSSFIEVYK